MSFHIIHLLSPSLRVRLELEQLHIQDKEKGTDTAVPLGDIAVIVCATPLASFTAAALRQMAERNVLLLLCDEKFQPAALTVPYYHATSTELLRSQVKWTPEWKERMWREVITAKVRNQAAVLQPWPRVRDALLEMARRCAADGAGEEASGKPPPLISQVTPGRRHLYHRNNPDAHESRAARLYWHRIIPAMNPAERGRHQGTRQGVNGMLDYGYAVIRTVVLRSLAAHGFIAALGIHHANQAGHQSLADDLMEPLRPFLDAGLLEHLQGGALPGDMKAWVPKAAAVLTATVRMGGAKVRLLNAVDLYVQSFATASQRPQTAPPLRIPVLSTP